MSKINNFQEEFSLQDIGIAKEATATYNCGMSRIALRAPGQIYRIRRSLMKEPKSASAVIVQTTLKMHYAIQVWCKAALISAENPSNLLYYWWLRWKQGEGAFNIIEYSNFYRDITVDQLLKWFWELLEQIANSGEIQVCEGYTIRCEGEGNTGPKVICDMVVDAEFARDIKYDNVYTYPYNKALVSYKWEDIKDFFIELTLDQLRLTMPKKLHNHTKLDDQLLKACFDWDVDMIKVCMKKGANINCLNERGESVLQCAVEYFKDHNVLMDKDYSKEELNRIETDNEIKCKEIVELLLSYGADINLFGYDGMPPLVCAYYQRSISMTKYLLEKGANPNTNCYLEDCHYWPMLKNIRSTILWCIDGLISEDYNEPEKEIEEIIRNAGGREYTWDYTPWDYENIGKYVIRMNPSRQDNHLFCDNAGRWIGTDTELTVEDNNDETSNVDVSSIEGLRQWNQDFQDNKTNPSYDWVSWKKRGFDLAKMVAEQLPEKVALFYLRDNKEVIKTYQSQELYLSHDGDYIRIK